MTITRASSGDGPPRTPGTEGADAHSLRRELQEARDTIEAIRRGGVDAVVVTTADGDRVYTLQTADQTYRHIVEQMQQGAAVLADDGFVVYANPQLESLAEGGRSVVGRSFPTLFPLEEGVAVRAALREACARPCTLETRLVGRGGRRVPVYLSASPLLTEGASVCVMVTDLTERDRYRETEGALRHFQTLSESSPVPIWVAAADGRLRFVNKAYAEFFGVLREGLSHIDWRQVVHADDVAAYTAAFEAARTGRTEFRAEARVRRADGQWRWVASHAAPWFSDGGEYLGFVGTSPDVTDLKRIEAALRESEERFRLATEAMQGALYDWYLSRPEITRTHGLKQLFGHAPEEVPASYDWWVAQIHPEDRVRAVGEFEAAVADGRTAYRLEYRMRHRSGDYVWVWDHGRITCGADGRAARVTGCILSIDAQKRLENALKQADAQKDRFLATLAHELRNPLAPIRNAVAVLKAKAPALPELRWGHEVIDRQVEQMARLLDDLLDVSRITQNKLHLRRERVDLRTVIARALETSRPLVEAHRHELTVRVPPQPLHVEVDPVRLSQAIANLLNNAAKYTDPGGRIWLTADRIGAEARVSVRDSGIGIGPDALPGVFEMFSQTERAAERSEGGLGIGLSLVRGLVELHGGTTEARSDGHGRGSEFVIRLPVAGAAAPAPQGRPADGPEPAPSLRVLVADDNRDSAESLGLYLTLQGCQVRTAFDGDEALAVAEEFRPHVALLDVGMPKLSGHDVARRIRERPWGRDVLLVAQTGWGAHEDQQRTHESGFDHHLVKPVAPAAVKDLLAAVRPSGCRRSSLRRTRPTEAVRQSGLGRGFLELWPGY